MMGDILNDSTNLASQLVRQIYMDEDFDFVGIALQENSGLRKIRWRYAAGYTSERFRKIVLRSGIGIAGLVVRTGKPFLENDLQHNQYSDYVSCPITQIEQLTSAAAIPLFDHETQGVGGVLLVGYRHAQQQVTQQTIAHLEHYRQSAGVLI
ncbi:GAF domain-containing protein [Loigolactobacillus bifermentans]|nr:GAF domain-containing protein [Loigolactobacillus bifermentans]